MGSYPGFGNDVRRSSCTAHGGFIPGRIVQPFVALGLVWSGELGTISMVHSNRMLTEIEYFAMEMTFGLMCRAASPESGAIVSEPG